MTSATEGFENDDLVGDGIVGQGVFVRAQWVRWFGVQDELQHNAPSRATYREHVVDDLALDHVLLFGAPESGAPTVLDPVGVLADAVPFELVRHLLPQR